MRCGRCEESASGTCDMCRRIFTARADMAARALAVVQPVPSRPAWTETRSRFYLWLGQHYIRDNLGAARSWDSKFAAARAARECGLKPNDFAVHQLASPPT